MIFTKEKNKIIYIGTDKCSLPTSRINIKYMFPPRNSRKYYVMQKIHMMATISFTQLSGVYAPSPWCLLFVFTYVAFGLSIFSVTGKGETGTRNEVIDWVGKQILPLFWNALGLFSLMIKPYLVQVWSNRERCSQAGATSSISGPSIYITKKPRSAMPSLLW